MGPHVYIQCIVIHFQLDCISPASLPGASDQEQPHCMAESDKDGVFSFPALPPGQYTLVSSQL